MNQIPMNPISMKKWRCRFCSHVYDEAKGDPDAGISAGTPFTQLPDDWICPDCGAGKQDYELMDD